VISMRRWLFGERERMTLTTDEQRLIESFYDVCRHYNNDGKSSQIPSSNSLD